MAQVHPDLSATLSQWIEQQPVLLIVQLAASWGSNSCSYSVPLRTKGWLSSSGNGVRLGPVVESD